MAQTERPAASAPAKAPPRAAAKGLFPTDSDTHVLDRLNAIYKYRYVVVTVFLLVLLAVAVRTFTTTPMYRATTSVLIEDERAASVAGFNSTTNAEYISDPEPYYQTQLRILTGRELAAKVVARLNLASVAEFNGQGPQRTGLASVLDTMKRQAQIAVARITGGAPPQLASARATNDTDALVNNFLGAVAVDPVRGSRLYNVSIQSANPTFAAKAADTLVEEYVKQNFERRTEATAKSLQFLAEEIKKQQTKVVDSERAMAQYRETNNALSLETGQNTVVANLTQVNDQYTRARTERIQKEAIYVQVKSLPSAALAESIPAVTNNQAVQSLRQRLAELQRDARAVERAVWPEEPAGHRKRERDRRHGATVPGRPALGRRIDPQRLRNRGQSRAAARLYPRRLEEAPRWT